MEMPSLGNLAEHPLAGCRTRIRLNPPNTQYQSLQSSLSICPSHNDTRQAPTKCQLSGRHVTPRKLVAISVVIDSSTVGSGGVSFKVRFRFRIMDIDCPVQASIVWVSVERVPL